MKDPLFDDTQMEELSFDAQARRAIAHMLSRIRDRPEVGYYCGLGTEAFALLTEAFATLTGDSVREVREGYLPENARDPNEYAPAEPGKALFRTVREFHPGNWEDLESFDREDYAEKEEELFRSIINSRRNKS